MTSMAKDGGRKFKEAREWLEANKEKMAECRANGVLFAPVLKEAGISQSTYYRVLKARPDLARAVDKGREELCDKLKGELYRRCFKHTLVTTKTYTKRDVETGRETVYTEKTEKEVDGDIAAIQILLKNNDPNWTDNPADLEMRRRELEWKIKKDKENLGL